MGHAVQGLVNGLKILALAYFAGLVLIFCGSLLKQVIDNDVGLSDFRVFYSAAKLLREERYKLYDPAAQAAIQQRYFSNSPVPAAASYPLNPPGTGEPKKISHLF